MKNISRLLLLGLLAFVILGLGGDMVVSAQENNRSDKTGLEFAVSCYFPDQGTSRYQMAVTDLAILYGNPGQKATNLSKQLADNLKQTAIFQILDKRSFLETNLSAGIDGKSKLDYEAWRRIGADFLIKGSIRQSTSATRLGLDLRLFDVLMQREILAKQYKGKPDEASNMINQFTNVVLEKISGMPGVFGSQIIFVSAEKSKKSVMMTAFGSDEVIQISDPTSNSHLFDLDMEHQMLVRRYTRQLGDACETIGQLSNTVLKVVMGAPGGRSLQVFFVAADKLAVFVLMAELGGSVAVQMVDDKSGPSTQPTLGPGGRTAWIHRSGKDWQLLVDGKVVSSGPLHLSPAFKPDGTVAAAYSGDHQTAIYTFSGLDNKNIIAGQEGGINVSPTFSPDGSRMAFVSDREGDVAIYTSSADGGPATRLTDTGKATDPAWSPTGDYIAFVSRETDICIIRPDGSGFRQLTGNQGRNYRPSFSPNGRMIVFSSDRNGRMQLFVMAVNGDRQQPLLPDYQASQDLPYWSPTMPENY